MAAIDVVEAARALIRCPSVTPAEGGALDLLQSWLAPLGFACHRLVFSEAGHDDVENLYARLGTAGPNFCYAGHTDVVPVGDPAAWTVDPFGAEVVDSVLYGRGAVDMKGAVAAFLAATAGFLEDRGPDFGGSLSFLITGDEEGVAVNGTRKVLAWLAERGETLDHCLVGEPTSDRRLGDMVKIGRRGAMNGRLTVHGTQGHSAYAHLADNPVHRLIRMLNAVTAEPLDDGSEFFPPTSLQIVSVDVGNPATNVIPALARAVFDCRFNDQHASADIEAWLRERFDAEGARYDLDIRVSGESFLTPPGRLSDLCAAAIQRVLGIETELGTTGGTSDARFIKDACPVAELGLRNATAHKVDEHVGLEELQQLTQVYRAVLEGYFGP
ncbi:MAG: succinyl-diaminopimelate desuccinylase [Kiloniellales bacterium]|nr:succinyl-diaminopimelate desuccinylase [Kiloniellales bacterium]